MLVYDNNNNAMVYIVYFFNSVVLLFIYVCIEMPSQPKGRLINRIVHRSFLFVLNRLS